MLKIRSAQRIYPVHIGDGLLSAVGRHPLLAERKCFVVTSPRILGLHGETLLGGFPQRSAPTVLLVPDGERHKNLRTIERLAAELATAGARRDSLLLAFGGGVIGDITGFLAAIYQRGIDFVQVPTTLLAQVDSSVGGKTGVNLPQGKNMLGSFHAPLAVFADIAALQTLRDREYRAGLFESIKCAIIRDPALYRTLERDRDAILQRDPQILQRVVVASIKVKAAIVQRDEHETGERMLLNFGHTIGHALESALNYKSLLHGEAVAYGMLAALQLSASTGAMPQPEADRATALIHAYGPLPSLRLDAATVLDLTTRDKKNTQHGQRLILARGIGDAFIAQGIPPRDILRSIESILQPRHM